LLFGTTSGRIGADVSGGGVTSKLKTVDADADVTVAKLSSACDVDEIESGVSDDFGFPISDVWLE